MNTAGSTLPESATTSAVLLFQACVSQVPAYQSFIKSEKADPANVKSYEDFKRLVPLVEKSNYLNKFSLPERCIGGSIFPGSIDFVHVSSGSTGAPTFWARYQRTPYT